MGALLLCQACAHTQRQADAGRRQAEAPAGPQLAYAFQLESQYSTELRDSQGQRSPLPGVQPEHRSWSGTISSKPARRFRDGSEGHLLRFQDVVVREGAAGGDLPAQPSPLSGRSAELRRFPSREILDIGLLEHLSDAEARGDLLLPLWAAISPVIPSLKPGRSSPQRANLPFKPERNRGARLVLDLDWTLLGEVELEDGTGAHHFSYQGAISGRGQDGAADWIALYDFTGSAQGELWLRSADYAVARNHFQWALDVEARFKGSSASALTGDEAAVLQRQASQGTLSLVGAP